MLTDLDSDLIRNAFSRAYIISRCLGTDNVILNLKAPMVLSINNLFTVEPKVSNKNALEIRSR